MFTSLKKKLISSGRFWKAYWKFWTNYVAGTGSDEGSTIPRIGNSSHHRESPRGRKIKCSTVSAPAASASHENQLTYSSAPNVSDAGQLNSVLPSPSLQSVKVFKVEKPKKKILKIRQALFSPIMVKNH